MQYRVIISNINWDTYDEDTNKYYAPEDCGLPIEDFEIDIDHDPDNDIYDELSDKVSDVYGWCHNGFTYKIKEETV